MKREGRKSQREGRKPEREEKGRVFKPVRLVAMGRIGKDRSKMKYGQRYPRLILRIKDDLLGKLEKEINRSQMNASDIARKALSEYLNKREQRVKRV